LWSVRPVVGTITFVEVGLMFGLFVWLLIEISDWYRKSWNAEKSWQNHL